MDHSVLRRIFADEGRFHEVASRSAAIMFIALLTGVANLGMRDERLSFACGTRGEVRCKRCIGIRFVGTFTDDDGQVDDSVRDPLDTGVDPGYDKRVGQCEARLVDGETVKVKLLNTYPSYTCHFWVKIKNTGTMKLRFHSPSISAPPELSLRVVEVPFDAVLYPGKRDYIGYSILVEQSTDQESVYQFTIENRFSQVTRACRGC